MKTSLSVLTGFAAVSIVLGVSGHAAGAEELIPSGYYSGSVGDTAPSQYPGYCMASTASVQFKDRGNGKYNVDWKEQGRLVADSSFCTTILDMQLTPTSRSDEWNVMFLSGGGLSFGTAKLEAGGALTVRATFTNSPTTFFASFATTPDGRALTYRREYKPQFGMTLRANGTLR